MSVLPDSFEPDPDAAIPRALDSESMIWLRAVLLPAFEHAQSWSDLKSNLMQKGYALTFRAGHLVVADETGRGLCTGAMLGMPLAALAREWGRPRLCSALSGQSATLRV